MPLVAFAARAARGIGNRRAGSAHLAYHGGAASADEGGPVIRLVLTDMDNTFVPFGADRVDARSVGAVRAVLDAGLPFGPATGRDRPDLLRLFDGDETCFRTGILSNGKRVYLQGRQVDTRLIEHGWLVRIDRALRALGMGSERPFLVCYPEQADGTNPAFGVGCTEAQLDVWARRVEFAGSVVAEVPEEDMIAATIACPLGMPQMDAARAAVEQSVPEVDLASPVPGWFDIMPHGVSKASGLDTLVAALGVSADEVAFFGDAENDLALLAKVGYPVAVANAVPAVAKAARYHVGACPGGVADALLDIARATREGREPDFVLRERA